MYGRDTDELLRRIATIRYDTLDVSRLQITSLPDLPDTLVRLKCSHTPIRRLPDLPSSLATLECEHTPFLTDTLELPDTLVILYCDYKNISSLQTFPTYLRYSYVYQVPPYLLQCCIRIRMKKNYTGRSYEVWSASSLNELSSIKRTLGRCHRIRMELIRAAWHPRRVMKGIEAGGWHVVEN